jgi:hypothetical protein
MNVLKSPNSFTTNRLVSLVGFTLCSRALRCEASLLMMFWLLLFLIRNFGRTPMRMQARVGGIRNLPEAINKYVEFSLLEFTVF